MKSSEEEEQGGRGRVLGVCKALAQKLPAGGLGGEVTAHVTGQPPQSQVPAVQRGGVERMDWGTGLGEDGVHRSVRKH